MNVKELFAAHPTVTADGAMGTYFSQLTGQPVGQCEKANLTAPETIRRIHQEYLRAGARLLRTNTFSANRFALHTDRHTLEAILTAGYRIAKQCAKDNAVVCADVSAIYDSSLSSQDIRDEYRFIIDTFLQCGAETFIFETLPDFKTVLPAVRYLLSVSPEAEVIVSFTLLPDGHTRSGTSVASLLDSLLPYRHLLTMVGFNCGCGAGQLLAHAAPFFSYIHENTDLYTIIMPNAGYPSIENGRTVFQSSPAYFAQQTARFLPCGVSALGGCCGTTPESICLLNQGIAAPDRAAVPQDGLSVTAKPQKHSPSPFRKNKFLLAAELDPPNTSDLSKILSAAKLLKQAGIDVITVSDSPLGHAKMDPAICSARIMREIGIEVLPHLCCRDRNINALRSALLGMHGEGIRSVLAVTGDHIAETDRGIIKPVFNIDSTRLMELVSRLNEDVFADSPMAVGGAYDPAPRKTVHALKRLDKKMANGAEFVLTQPIFSENALASLDQARAKGIKVLAGIMPLVSYRNACFMQNEVPGMEIPDELVSRFRPDISREEAAAVGVQIAVELAQQIKSHADGFYFITPFNRAEIIQQILEQL